MSAKGKHMCVYKYLLERQEGFCAITCAEDDTGAIMSQLFSIDVGVISVCRKEKKENLSSLPHFRVNQFAELDSNTVQIERKKTSSVRRLRCPQHSFCFLVCYRRDLSLKSITPNSDGVNFVHRYRLNTILYKLKFMLVKGPIRPWRRQVSRRKHSGKILYFLFPASYFRFCQ